VALISVDFPSPPKSNCVFRRPEYPEKSPSWLPFSFYSNVGIPQILYIGDGGTEVKKEFDNRVLIAGRGLDPCNLVQPICGDFLWRLSLTRVVSRVLSCAETRMKQNSLDEDQQTAGPCRESSLGHEKAPRFAYFRARLCCGCALVRHNTSIMQLWPVM
jgi:hypothetical protein